MADDLLLNLGSGGGTLATDEVSSRHFQWVKLRYGTDDTVTIVESGVGLPVELQNATATGTITVVSTGVSVSADPAGIVGISILGTWVATLDFEATIDGTTWFAITAQNKASGALVSSTTVNGNFLIPAGGYAQVRVFASAFTSGTVDVDLESSTGGNSEVLSRIHGAVADGSAVIGNPVAIAGVDGAGNVQAVLTGTDGSQMVQGNTGPDAPFNSNPVVMGGRASALIPADVDTDGDAVSAFMDRAGRIHNTADSEIGESNTTPLGISGVFTGVAHSLAERSAVSVIMFADEASAADGVELQFSRDATNWDTVYKYNLVANVGRIFTAPALSANFRIILTNGGTAQTIFRMTTYLHRGVQLPLSQAIDGESVVVEPTLMSGLNAGNAQSMQVDSAGVVAVSLVGNRRVEGGEAHDVPITLNPHLMAGAASAAAPTDVSLDDDVVRLWALLNGSQVVNLASGGTLIAAEADDDSVASGGTHLPSIGLDYEFDGTNWVRKQTRAHDAVDAGDPTKIGYKALAHSASPTAVAALDRVDAPANRHGIPFVIGGHPNIEHLSRLDTAVQTNAILKTVAAGEKWITTAYSIYVSADVTAAPSVLLETGTTRIWESGEVIAGGGISRGAGSGILAIGADGDDLLWTCSVPTGGDVLIEVSGYIVPS